jgi:hypothetical protein
LYLYNYWLLRIPRLKAAHTILMVLWLQITRIAGGQTFLGYLADKLIGFAGCGLSGAFLGLLLSKFGWNIYYL